MSKKESTLLENIVIYPDIFRTLITNSAYISENIRKDYLKKTDSLISQLKEIIKDSQFKKKILDINISPQDKVVQTLIRLKNKTIGALDGGLGTSFIGAVTPFIMRAVTYSVKIGDKSVNREKFTPARFLVNRLRGGGLNIDESRLGALLLLFELSSALESLKANKNYEIFLIHGPLVRSLPQYSIYTFEMSDLKQIMGKENFEEFYDHYRSFEDKYGSFGLNKKELSYFLAVTSILKKIFLIAKENEISIVGIVERSNSTELIQTLIYKHFNEIYREKKDWFIKINGEDITGKPELDKIRYIKQFLDNLGYTDTLLFGSILEEGEYSEFQLSRQNKSQEDNRKIGLDVGFIGRLTNLERFVPESKFSYIRTSYFNRPFKIEIPSWINKSEEKKIVDAIYTFSKFLPRYAFPVNLDVVDKVAKVSNQLTKAFMFLIEKDIYNGLIEEGKCGRDLPLSLLSRKMRDWQYRPSAATSIIKHKFKDMSY